MTRTTRKFDALLIALAMVSLPAFGDSVVTETGVRDRMDQLDAKSNELFGLTVLEMAMLRSADTPGVSFVLKSFLTESEEVALRRLEDSGYISVQSVRNGGQDFIGISLTEKSKKIVQVLRRRN